MDLSYPDLQRFVTAQDAHGTYDAALAELRRGRKTTHWMWFVLPQLLGLGQSAMAREYGVRGLDEARAYLDHPVLGPRLRECCAALLGLGTSDAEAVLGGIDAVKLRSSTTLFTHAAGDEGEAEVFRAVLDRFFGGVEDEATLALLAGPASS